MSGHRTLADEDRLRGPVGTALDRLHGNPGDDPAAVLVSALAEGADRLVADVALERGWALEAVLPFAREEYERDFPTKESIRQFAHLLARAGRVRELPGHDRPGGYARLGGALLDGADVLLAVWTGHKAEGPGGTADVVAEARARGRPVAWVDAADGTLRMEGFPP